MKFRRKVYRAEKRPRIDADGVCVGELDKEGREVLDPVPVAPPVKIAQRKSVSLLDQVRAEMRRERAAAEAYGDDDNPDDLDVPDDDDLEPLSEYEIRVLDFLRANPPPSKDGTEEGGGGEAGPSKTEAPPEPPPVDPENAPD